MERKKKNIVSICFVCILWYNFSTFANVLAKKLMNDFPYPITITIVQFIVAIIYLKPIFYIFNIPYVKNYHLITKRKFFYYICPLALGKFISTACAHFSIWKVSISYAHTVKATMPLFTIFLAKIFLNEKQTLQVYASIIPIICGVLLASITEFDFNMLGLSFALISTFVFAFMNIFSKKLLNETKIHHLTLLYVLSSVGVVLFLPLWFYSDFPLLTQNRDAILEKDIFHKILLYLFLNTSCNFGQNMMAFTLLNMTAPLSYSVANVTKRIWVICLSLIFMGNKTSVLNVLGMALAILGIFLYQRTKYQSRLKQLSVSISNDANPYYDSQPNGNVLPIYYKEDDNYKQSSHYPNNYNNGIQFQAQSMRAEVLGKLNGDIGNYLIPSPPQTIPLTDLPHQPAYFPYQRHNQQNFYNDNGGAGGGIHGNILFDNNNYYNNNNAGHETLMSQSLHQNRRPPPYQHQNGDQFHLTSVLSQGDLSEI